MTKVNHEKLYLVLMAKKYATGLHPRRRLSSLPQAAGNYEIWASWLETGGALLAINTLLAPIQHCSMPLGYQT